MLANRKMGQRVSSENIGGLGGGFESSTEWFHIGRAVRPILYIYMMLCSLDRR